jgi:hypothetical protein
MVEMFPEPRSDIEVVSQKNLVVNLVFIASVILIGCLALAGTIFYLANQH